MWANRMFSLSVALGFVGLLHAVEPQAAERQRWLYLIALPVGYGHLLGGLLFSLGKNEPSAGWGH